MFDKIRKIGKSTKETLNESEALFIFKLIALFLILLFLPPIISGILAALFIFGYFVYRDSDY